MKKALLASIQDSEISNPWVLDRSGRHANISALFDWPDSSDSDTDEDEITDRSSAAGTPSSPKVISTTPEAGKSHITCIFAVLMSQTTSVVNHQY